MDATQNLNNKKKKKKDSGAIYDTSIIPHIPNFLFKYWGRPIKEIYLFHIFMRSLNNQYMYVYIWEAR